MTPYFDENIGNRIPSAFKILGLKVIAGVSKKYGRGQGDIEYLKRTGRKGWLAISADKNMLEAQNEREAIISERAGIVFITDGHIKRPSLMLLLLKKWSWLETIDEEEQRPFAFYLYPSGRIRKVELN